MIARQKRIARFTQHRPVFRPLVAADWPVICVAYDRGAFDLPADLLPEVVKEAVHSWERTHRLLIAEDKNTNFRSGRGPVALVKIRFDGWKSEPELIKFPWATKTNVVRGMVTFLLDMKRSKDMGVCLIACQESSAKFLLRMADLKLLFRCGYVPNGYCDSPMWMFNVSGRKQREVVSEKR